MKIANIVECIITLSATMEFARLLIFAVISAIFHIVGSLQKATFLSPSASIDFALGRKIVATNGGLVLSRGIDSIKVATLDWTGSKPHCTIEPSAADVFLCDVRPTLNGSYVLTLTYNKTINDHFFDHVNFVLTIGTTKLIERLKVTKCQIFHHKLFATKELIEANYGNAITIHCNKGYMLSNISMFSPTDRFNSINSKCSSKGKWQIPDVKCVLENIYDFSNSSLSEVTTLNTKENVHVVCRNKGKMAKIVYMNKTLTGKDKVLLEKMMNYHDNGQTANCIVSNGRKIIEKKLKFNVLYPPILKKHKVTLRALKGRILNASIHFMANPPIPGHNVRIIKVNSSDVAPNVSVQINGSHQTISIIFGKTDTSTFGSYVLTMFSDKFGNSSVVINVRQLKGYFDEFTVALFIGSAIVIFVLIFIILCCFICVRKREERYQVKDIKLEEEKHNLLKEDDYFSSDEDEYIEIDDAEEARSSYEKARSAYEEPKDDLMYKNTSNVYQEYSAVYSQAQNFER